MSYCIQCGQESTPGARFCTACGRTLGSVATTVRPTGTDRALSSPPGRRRVSWKHWLFIGGATILLVVILAVAFGTGSDNPDLDVQMATSPSGSTFNSESQATAAAQGSTLTLEQGMQLYAMLGREAVSAIETAEEKPTSTDTPILTLVPSPAANNMNAAESLFRSRMGNFQDEGRAALRQAEVLMELAAYSNQEWIEDVRETSAKLDEMLRAAQAIDPPGRLAGFHGHVVLGLGYALAVGQMVEQGATDAQRGGPGFAQQSLRQDIAGYAVQAVGEFDQATWVLQRFDAE